MKKLILDQKSNFKGKIYGFANETIEIIGDHGNIVTVLSQTGNKFFVLKENLADAPLEPEDKKEQIKPIIEPVKIKVRVDPFHGQKPLVTKQTNKAPTLF